jgi:hypothetical protein
MKYDMTFESIAVWFQHQIRTSMQDKIIRKEKRNSRKHPSQFFHEIDIIRLHHAF